MFYRGKVRRREMCCKKKKKPQTENRQLPDSPAAGAGWDGEETDVSETRSSTEQKAT